MSFSSQNQLRDSQKWIFDTLFVVLNFLQKYDFGNEYFRFLNYILRVRKIINILNYISIAFFIDDGSECGITDTEKIYFGH